MSTLETAQSPGRRGLVNVSTLEPPSSEKRELATPFGSSFSIWQSALPLGKWHGGTLVTPCYASCYAWNVQNLPYLTGLLRCYASKPLSAEKKELADTVTYRLQLTDSLIHSLTTSPWYASGTATTSVNQALARVVRVVRLKSHPPAKK